MRLALGVPLLWFGCASGGRPFEAEPADSPPAPESDAPPVEPPPPPPVDAMPDTPTACVAVATETLVNPSLDLAPQGTGWTEVPIAGLPGGPFPIITADGAISSAPFAAWLGGAAGLDALTTTVTDQLFQDVTFPADATDFVVSGMSAVGGVEVTTAVFDTFTLDVLEPDGTLIENVMKLDNTMPNATFTAFSKTLATNLAGRTVRLRATSTNDITDHTNFFLDSLSFKATFCP